MKASNDVQKKPRRLITTAALAVLVMMLLITVVGVSSAAADEAALEPAGLATLGDFVWYDINLDGEQAGELLNGINGVTITLYRDLGAPGDTGDGTFDPIDPLNPGAGGTDPIYTEPEYPDPGPYTEDGLRTTANDTGGDPGWYDFSITADGYWYWVVIDDSNFAPGGALEGYVFTSGDSIFNAGDIYGEPGVDLRMLVKTSGIFDDINDADFGFAEAVIEINKTVYAGHNAGVGCAGGELVNGENGDLVTYCFEVTNNGDTYLDAITIDDPDLVIDETNMTLLSGSEPLAPNASLMFYYETTLNGDLVNTATTTGNPTDAGGTDLPGASPSASDTAAVAEYAPDIEIQKTVYAGHAAGTGCAGATELVYGEVTDPVTYCFTVTNIGDTYLDTITIADPNLGINETNMTAYGGVSTPLAPNASLNFYYETTITADLLNTATTIGNPTDPGGIDLPGLTNPTDDDTAEVAMIDPGILVVKRAGSAADGDTLTIATPGGSVTYSYAVTLDGDTPLLVNKTTGVDVTDNKCFDPVYGGGDTGSVPGLLEAGETWTFSCTTNVAVDTTNIATAVGDPADAAGTPLPGINDVQDTDDAVVDVIDPGIQVVKTAGSTPDGDTLHLVIPGGSVTYNYAVSLDGDTPLLVDKTPGTDVTDDKCINPVYGGGDAGVPGLLESGETWTFTCTTNVAVDTTNIATAVGDPADAAGIPLPDINDVQDTDDAVVDIIDPGILVVKTAGSAADGDTLHIATPGGNVTYTYNVTLDGDTPLLVDITAGTDVTDDKCVDPAYVSGDGVVTGLLEAGETWVFTCTTNVAVDTTNIVTAVGDPADAAGTPLPGINDVQDTDDAVVDVIEPGILVVKTAGSAPDGDTLHLITPGGSVIYRYEVTLDGDTPLLVDKTPGTDVTDDKCIDPTYISGDSVVLGLLEAGETWIFTCTTNVAVDTTNIATAVGDPADAAGVPLPDINDVQDTDDAVVDIIDPGILVVKTAGSSTPDGETLHLVTPGGSVTYNYAVSLDGDTPLLVDTTPGTDVTDDKCLNPAYVGGDTVVLGLLEAGETWIFACTTNVAIDTTNIATAVGDPADAAGTPLPGVNDVQDTDDAVVDIIDPGILVVKRAGSAADGDKLYLPDPGGSVIYSYAVTLDGDTPLLVDKTAGTDVTDDKCFDPAYVSGDGVVTGLLEAGETWIFTCTTNVTTDTTNIATAVGDPADATGTPLPGINDVQDTDDAVVDIVRPEITVTKTLMSAEPARPNKEVHFQITIENTGDVWIYELPLDDVFDTEYLSYGFGVNYATPNSNNNINDGTIEWDDLTQATPYGFGIDLEPTKSFVVDVYFTAEKDTTLIPANPPYPAAETVNTAIVDGALADPDGPGGTAPPPSIDVPSAEDWDSVRIEQPTGVGLVSFDAKLESGDALLTWETAVELDLVGFKVLRKRGQSDYSEITDIIPAEHPGAGAGASYQYVDEALSPGAYTYALLAVKFDGSMRLLSTDSVLLRWADPFATPTEVSSPSVSPSN